MAKRTGVPSIQAVNREQCRLLAKYGALIKVLYPTEPDVVTIIDAAVVACNALAELMENLREYGD